MSRLWSPHSAPAEQHSARATTSAAGICCSLWRRNTQRVPSRTSPRHLQSQLHCCCRRGSLRVCWPESVKSCEECCRALEVLSVTNEHSVRARLVWVGHSCPTSRQRSGKGPSGHHDKQEVGLHTG